MNVTVANLLRKFLGDWVETECLEKFSVSLMNGSVRLNNLKLKPSLIENLGLPYILKCGHIGQLQIETSISSIHSKPIKVKIDDLNMLITPRKWMDNRENEAELIHKIQDKMKVSQLEVFEIIRANLLGSRMMEEEYIERISSDLVNNLQIEVRNLYIRIEDSLSYDKHFAMGFVIKELNVKSQELHSTEDKQLESIASKRLKIEDLSVYIDYSENYDLISSSHTEELSDHFLMFISQEHQNESINPNHQFLILNAALSIDLYINQNGEDLSRPQVSGQIYDLKIDITLDLEQIIRAGKTANFISEYTEYKFKRLSCLDRKSDDQLAEEYKEIYKVWLFCKDSRDTDTQDKARILRRRMKSIERAYTLDEIKSLRNLVKGGLKFKALEEEKINEILKIESHYQISKIEGIKKWFGYGKSQDEFERVEQEKKNRIDKLKEEIDTIKLMEAQHSQDIEDLLKHTSTFSNLPSDYNRFHLVVNMESFKLIITHNSNSLMNLEVNSTTLELFRRISSIKFDISIGESNIYDLVTNSMVFPKLLYATSLHFSYDNYSKTCIDAKSSDFYLVLNLDFLLSLHNKFKNTIYKEFDIRSYHQKVMEKAEKVYSISQKYVADTLQSGVSGDISLNISLKAPVFFLPYDINSLSSVFVIDLGYIKSESLKEEKNGLWYYTYDFILKDLEMVIVRNCSDLLNWSEGKYDFILRPLTVECRLYKSMIEDPNLPSIIFESRMGKVEFLMNDKDLQFIVKLGDTYANYINIIKYEFQYEEEKDSSVQVVREVEQNQHRNMISAQLLFELESVFLHLRDSERETIKILASNLSWVVDISQKNLIEADIKLEKLEIIDTREEIAFNYIISNPLNYKTTGSEEEEDFHDAEEEIKYQIKAGIKIYPAQDLVEFACLISNIRIVLFPEFISSLENYIKNLNLDTSHDYYENSSSTTRTRKISLVEDLNAKVLSQKYNLTVSIGLSEFELWLPMNCMDINTTVANLSFSPVITFCSSREYTVSFNKYGRVVNRNLVFLDDEATLEVRHLNVIRGYVRKNKIRRTVEQFSDLINPCRISLDYKAISKKENIIQKHANITLESIEVVFGFRDIYFFKQLGAGWKISSTTTSETLIQFLFDKVFAAYNNDDLEMKINCKSLHLTMIEDTGVSPYSLVHSQFTNVDMSMHLCRYFHCYLKSRFMADYYNIKLSCWEPLIEDWQFSTTAQREAIMTKYETAPILKVLFTSSKVLNFNISHSMAETLSTMIEKLKLDKGTWAKENIEGEIRVSNEALAHGLSSYTIINNLGITCYAWISEKGSQKWKIKPGETKDFTQGYIEELRINQGKTTKKLGLMSGLQQVASLIIHLEGFTSSEGFKIEDGLTKSYKVKSKDTELELIMDITGLGNVRYLSIETSSKVMNNTHRNILVFGVDSEGHHNESILVKKMHSKAIPASFIINKLNPCIRDLKDKLVPLDDTQTIKINPTDFITVEIIKLETEGEKLTQKILQVSSPVIFRNCVPCPIEIFIKESSSVALRLNPGDTSPATFVKAMNSASYKFKLIPYIDKEIESGWFDITKEIQHIPLTGNFPASSLTIQVTNQNFSKNKDTNLINRVRCVEEDVFGLNTKTGLDIRSNQSKLIEIYFDYILVNKTDYDFIIYQNQGISLNTREIAFFHDENKDHMVKISHQGSDRHWTQSINFNSLGVKTLLFDIPKDSKMHTKLIVLKIHEGLAPLSKTKIVSFMPRYMISNLLDFPIYIKQFTPALEDQDDYYIEVNQGESIPFNLIDPNLGMYLIQIGVSKDKLSLPFNAEELNDFQIMIPSLESRSSTKGWSKILKQDFESCKWYAPSFKNKFMHYVRIVITTTDNATININFMNPRYPEFRLKNKTSKDIICFQESCTQFTIKPNETLPYAFENHSVGTKKVVVKLGKTQRECAIEKLVSMKKIGKKYGMTVDLKDYSKRLIIEERDKSIKRIKFQRQIIEDKMRERLSVFLPKDEISSSQSFDTKLRRTTSKSILDDMGVGNSQFETVGEVELIVSLNGFGLSVIDEQPKETFYLSLRDINIVYKEAELKGKHTTVFMRSLLFSLQHVQLDNMLAKLDMFPVIFTSVNRDINQPFLVISIGQKVQHPISKKNKQKSTSTSMLDWFIVKFQEIHIKINQEVIDHILKIRNKILNTIYFKDETTEIMNEFTSMYGVCSDLETCNPISKVNPSQVDKKIYINTFQIEPLKISLTFRSAKKKIEFDISNISNVFGIRDILSSLGSAFFNFTDVPLYFDYVELFHSFQSPPVLMIVIMRIYITKFLFQTYKLLGTSDMIGNPISLVDKISTGVSDIFNCPIRACKQSDSKFKFDPIAFSNGVSMGINSFLTNTISGSFDSVSKITGSFYNAMRQIGGHSHGAARLEESPNVAVGIYKGVLGSIEELYDGISGIFIKPYEGAKQSGCAGKVVGMMKGLGGGILGAVVSPVSATLRLSTELTASIANNAQMFEFNGVNLGRSRFPRQFGARKILEPYIREIAQIQELLSNIPKLKREVIEYYVPLEDYENAIVVVTGNRVLLLSSEKVENKISIKNIETREFTHSAIECKLDLKGSRQRLILTSNQYSAMAKLNAVLKELTSHNKEPTICRSNSMQPSL